MNPQLSITDHLDEISSLIEKDENITNEASETIEDKKSIVCSNIQEIERQYEQLQNMNLFLKLSIDQNNEDQSKFAKEANKNTKEINELIDGITKRNKNEESKELNRMVDTNVIKDNLFQFYKNKIDQSKLNQIEKRCAFNKFFIDQLEIRKTEFKERHDNEKPYSQDEIIPIQELIVNLNEM